MEVSIWGGGKNSQNKRRSKVSSQKRLTVVKWWFTQGSELDEKNSSSNGQT